MVRNFHPTLTNRDVRSDVIGFEEMTETEGFQMLAREGKAVGVVVV